MTSKLLPTGNILPTFLTFIFFIFFFALVVTAQSQTVSGVVRSAPDNQPLSGVTVQIKGTSNSTATDPKGHYLLRNLSSSDSLFFSYIGFKNETVAVNSRTTKAI